MRHQSLVDVITRGRRQGTASRRLPKVVFRGQAEKKSMETNAPGGAVQHLSIGNTKTYWIGQKRLRTRGYFLGKVQRETQPYESRNPSNQALN